MKLQDEKIKFNDTIKLYKNLLQEHGLSLGALGCAKGKQFLRFNQLTSNFNLEGASILDVGCGYGDFCKYLEFIGTKNYFYTGIDLMDEFIAEAMRRYPSEKHQFIKNNFISHEFANEFDYVICSGVFNSKIDDISLQYRYIEQSMNKMFKMARKAIALDFLSDKVEHAYSHNFNSSPENILKLGYKLSRNIMIRNDYFPFEFAIILNKDDSFKKETSVFNAIDHKIKWLGI